MPKSIAEVNALARLALYMRTTKKRILINACSKSQFNNFPLV